MELMRISHKTFIGIYLFSVLLLIGSLGLFMEESGQIHQTKEELTAANKSKELLSERIKEVSDKVDLETTEFHEEKSLTVKKENEESKQEDMEIKAPVYMETLKREIEGKITALQTDGSQWSVYFHDLNSGGNFALYNNKMQAASLIKLFIMGCVYEDYETMTLKDTREQIDEWLKTMITVSDNEAANQLVYVLGGGNETEGREKVDQFAADHGYVDTHMGRLLLASNAEDDNYTSVLDCGKFLQDCYENRLSHSGEMQELLKQQTRRQKIPAGLPSDVVVGNKTGELQTVQNDAAIVYTEEHPYLLCIMSQELSNSDAAISQISELSQSVYASVIR